MKITGLFLVYLFFAASSVFPSGDKNAVLNLMPVQEDFFYESSKGTDPLASANVGKKFVIGDVNIAGFSVSDINNIALYDDSGMIPVIVDKSSIYSEFGNGKIDSVRIGLCAGLCHGVVTEDHADQI